MAEMTHQDTITILNRLDLQVKQLQQERAAFAYVAEILKKFEDARRGLEGLDRTRLELEAVVAGLRERITGEESALRKPFLQERDGLKAEIETFKTRATEAKEKTRLAEQRLNEAEKAHTARAAELDADIRAKVDALDKASNAFEAFKLKHGLT